MSHVSAHCTLALALTLALATDAMAYEFRVRFVERIGSADHVLENNTIDAAGGAPRRVRVQFGIFDDDEGPAPAGGYLGWNVGTIDVNGDAGNSDEFRNSALGVPNGVGRLSPFNFAPSSQGANGLPAEDPFESLVGVDNTLGFQFFPWPEGEPMPEAVVRGRNTFVNTYEITVDPAAGAADYSIDFAGNVLGVTEWVPQVEEDPGGNFSVLFLPHATEPVAFSARLLIVPAPASIACVPLGLLVLARRRRSRFPLTFRR